MSVFIALIVVVQDHRQVHFTSAKWLILFAIPGIPIGVAVLLYIGVHYVKVCLGVLIICYALYALLGKKPRRLHRDHKGWLFLFGFLSGVLGGAYGINGPPLVVYGNMREWNARQFRATYRHIFCQPA